MVETLRFSKIGAEDLAVGTGTFEADLSDGRRVSLTKINLSTFGTSTLNNGIFYVDNAGETATDAQFIFNDTSNTMLIGAGGTLSIGADTIAASRGELYVVNDGAVSIALENTGTTVADQLIVWYKEAAAKWNLGVDDSNSDRLQISSGAIPITVPHLLFSDSNTAVVMGSQSLNVSNDAGLTINQGTNDDEILSLKSSDVAHGVTDDAETDTYFHIKKETASQGGADLTALTEGDNALTLRGIDTLANTAKTGAANAPVIVSALKASGTSVASMAINENVFCVKNGDLTQLIVDADGDLLIDGGLVVGDLTASQTNNANGVVIDQGITSDEILTLKSGFVSHGLTFETQADTFMYVGIFNSADGGAVIRGFTETSTGINLNGLATTNDTTESTAGVAPVLISAGIKGGGTSAVALAAADNILVIRNLTTATAIFKGDGDLELDGTVTSGSFDEHNDIMLLDAFKAIGNPDYRQRLGTWVEDHLDILEKGRVITRYEEDGRSGYFVSTKGIHGLFVDAIRQLAGRIDALEG